MIYWNEYEKYAGSTGGMGEYIQPEDSTRFSTNREPKEIYPLVTSANNNPQSEGPRVKAKKEKKKTGYVTKKAFAIGMICAMLATSGLTIGGLGLAGAFDRTVPGDTKVISATNYSLAEYTGAKKSIEEIVAMNENAVVEIVTDVVVSDRWMFNYITQGAGSGVIVDSSGYILTCNHVIEGAKSITVTTKDGQSYKAKLVGGDSLSDVAVLKIEGSGFVAAQYGDSSKLSIGDLAVAIGNPLGKLGGSASVGIISSLNRDLVLEGKSMTLLQTDASINPGNSGGGLFDGEGNLIGIVVAKSKGSDVEGIGFAIPIEKAAEIAKQIIDEGKVSGRAAIGIMIVDATNVAYAYQYGFDAPGVYVQELTGDEAKASGLQVGDAITSFNGVEITSGTSLTKEVMKCKPGDTATITVLREGKPLEIETVLKEAE